MIGTGTLVDGKYAIIRAVGAGGFGAVYEASQIQFDRKVAIKIIATNLLMEPDGAARFEREAKALDLLRHKNIVGCYGYGVWDGAPYMVMEYVDGISLEKIISKEGSLSFERSLKIMRQVLEGLSSAHAAGIVHRDLKPSNIMIAQEADGKEIVKIIDFGLVKLMPGYGIAGQQLTETGYAVGSCMYMAPEQALGEAIDERADIYAAGAILYQMLSGQPPFQGDANVAVMFQHLNAAPPPLQQFLPPSAPVNALCVLVDNCLAKHRETRYSDSTSVIKDIDAILSGSGVKLSPLGTQQMQALQQPAQKSNRPIFIAIALTAVISGLGTLAIANFTSQKALISAGSDPATQADSTLLRKIARTRFDEREYTWEQLHDIETRALGTQHLKPFDWFVLNTAFAKLYGRRYQEKLKIRSSGMWMLRTDCAAYGKAALRLLSSVPDNEQALSGCCLAESFSDCGLTNQQRVVLNWLISRRYPPARYEGACMLAHLELQTSESSQSQAFENAETVTNAAMKIPMADGHAAKLIRAHIDFLAGQIDAAQRGYELVGEEYDQATCACGLARIALAKGNYSGALKQAELARHIAANGDHKMLAAELLIAAALKAQGHHAEAEQLITTVEKDESAYSPELSLLGKVDYRLAHEARKGFVPNVVPI